MVIVASKQAYSGKGPRVVGPKISSPGLDVFGVAQLSHIHGDEAGRFSVRIFPSLVSNGEISSPCIGSPLGCARNSASSVNEKGRENTI